MSEINNIEHDWGWEFIWANTEKYYSRILIIKEGEVLPLSYHKKQDKTILVLQGIVRLEVGGSSRILNEKEAYRIYPRVIYGLSAIKGDATILESGTAFEHDVVEVSR
jgi:mannose-6-phosphate isomerase-like protein (cupin superfamily)